MSEESPILRGTITLVDDTPKCQTLQVATLDPDRPHEGVEHFQPVGISVLPSLDEECLVFEVNGAPDHLVVIGASQRGRRPTDLTKPGTGGLHYLGEWRVFMDDDGTLHLGKRDPSDFVALASKVDAELQKIADALEAVSAGGGADFTGTNTYTAPTAVGSTKVRAE